MLQGANRRREACEMKRAPWTGLSLLLACLSVPAFGADKDASPGTKREKCIDEALGSPGMRQAEELGGRLGVEEYLIETCGFRPVVETDRQISLTTEDCATVYSWSKDGLCDTYNLSWGDNVMRKALDPRAFDFDKFVKRCELNNAGQRHERFSTFKKHVCTARVHHQSKKPHPE